MVPPGGFSRGEQFERERVVPPLSRLLCLLSCRGKKVRPRWQALAESHLEKKLKGYDRVTMTTSKYRPIMKPELHPRLLPQSRLRRASSLPEGAMGCVPCHIGLCFWRSTCCTIPQTRLTPCQLPTVGSYGVRTFSHWLVLWGSASCESLSHAYGVPAPFGKGAFLRPVSEQSPTLPREPLGAVAIPGGILGKRE